MYAKCFFKKSDSKGKENSKNKLLQHINTFIFSADITFYYNPYAVEIE